MSQIKFLFVALLLAIMAGATVGTVGAQGTTVENFRFAQDAVWEQTPYFARLGGGVNVRLIPSERGNDPVFSFAAGNTVQVVASYMSGDQRWLLVRGWNRNGYVGHGWMHEGVANPTRINRFTVPAAPDCALTDGGVQVSVAVRFNAGWTHDALSTSCTLFYEGRVEATEAHHYWVIRDSNTEATQTVTTTHYLRSGFIWLLEGTGWQFPTNWNIARGMSRGDTGQDQQYVPVVAMFAADKQQVMRDNNYAWPIVVHTITGGTLTYQFGAFGTQPNDVNRCDFTEPQVMPLTGIFDPTTRTYTSISIGAVGCRTVLFWQLPNRTYELAVFMNAREQLEYRTLYTAVLIPSSWSNQQVRDFLTDVVIPSAELSSGTQVTVNGVNGMTTFTIR